MLLSGSKIDAGAPPAVRRLPLADYAAASRVVVHQLASEIAPGFVGALVQVLGRDRVSFSSAGYQGPRSGYGGDTSLVWERDYHPTLRQESDGSLTAVKFLDLNPRRSSYDGSTYVPVQPPTPDSRYLGSPPHGQWVRTEQVPLLHRGGNMAALGDHLLVGEKLLSDNAEAHSEKHLREAGYQPRTREQVLQMLSQATGVPTEQIVVAPGMPGERTGDVDVWALAVAPNRVMVPCIEPEALQVLGYAHEREHGGHVGAFLDEQAERLRAAGLTVDRLPMLAPVDLHEGGSHVYSPANSLLFAGPEGQEAFVPTFAAAGFPGDYQALHQRYQEQWKGYFESVGWRPHLEDATRLGQANGLFRCITQTQPPPPARPA